MCFHVTGFPMNAQMAIQLTKSRATLALPLLCREKFGNSPPKPLDFSDHSTNNAVIDIVLMYLLIRSEQAEEGARSFLLLWLV